jgi:hypothetical protein
MYVNRNIFFRLAKISNPVLAETYPALQSNKFYDLEKTKKTARSSDGTVIPRYPAAQWLKTESRRQSLLDVLERGSQRADALLGGQPADGQEVGDGQQGRSGKENCKPFFQNYKPFFQNCKCPEASF